MVHKCVPSNGEHADLLAFDKSVMLQPPMVHNCTQESVFKLLRRSKTQTRTAQRGRVEDCGV